ncbi:protein of unknown function DUF46 [Pyrolobus fumarii 1A]|uniref:CDP-archaeol synthase n=1 Tax=Pyrolobus fumarii (strain DSM 11204 / 1A) TaxID=694429 RepID=G0EEU7_PYRF1|nr:CDP-2,3-bis-(O-geranylgeranyl)-sn-glycerol synthase [Pyrolobus fumarii]AEM38061.1 protein of unknown function DUF46 [Pyrolobus fumarii 1A]
MLAEASVFIAIYVPALVANGSATLISRGHPIDMGLRLPDGRRVLGDGKTVEGFTLAMLYATSIAFTFALLLNNPLIAYYGVIAGLGALIGDMVGSFTKRRLGLERGAHAPILDQLDFIIGAYLLTIMAGYKPNLIMAIAFAVMVYMLHRITNIVAYRLGIKSVPW